MSTKQKDNLPIQRLTDSSTHGLERFDNTAYRKTIQNQIKKGTINIDTKSLYIYNKTILHNRLAHLKSVFPQGTNHAVAIKSNSEIQVLKEIVNYGCGLEAASFEEVLVAKEAGCPNDKLVFDSPVKTTDEIERCNESFRGMIINANCFEELDRLKGKENIRVGIRINPLINLNNPGIYNVSENHSKFGIPITRREKIVEYALKMENCCGLHIHAGSEIGNEVNHARAIASIVELAEEIKLGGKKLNFIDIGGGVPARMEPGEQKGLSELWSKVINLAPEIQNYQIITEYGRFVQAHTAFVISRVEYILDHSNPNIALIHVGADLFPREIYSSHPPFHQIFVFDKEGNLKENNIQLYDIGGPLCFSGDFLTRNRALPEIKPGDWICIADTGANTLSMWSRHCGRAEVEVLLV